MYPKPIIALHFSNEFEAFLCKVTVHRQQHSPTLTGDKYIISHPGGAPPLPLLLNPECLIPVQQERKSKQC